MAIHIGLHNFTDEGIRNIDQTVQRAEEFRALAAKSNVAVKDVYWTQGDYDVVTVVEGEDADVAALYLLMRKKGYVKGKVVRAYTPAEMTTMILGF